MKDLKIKKKKESKAEENTKRGKNSGAAEVGRPPRHNVLGGGAANIQLQLWSNFLGHSIRVGGRNLEVETPMASLGALLCRDRAGAVGGRAPGGDGAVQVLGHEAAVR